MNLNDAVAHLRRPTTSDGKPFPEVDKLLDKIAEKMTVDDLLDYINGGKKKP